jgi:hypothetical protein
LRNAVDPPGTGAGEEFAGTFSTAGHEGGTDGQRAEAKQQGSEEAEGEQAQDFGVRLQKIGHSERPQVAMSHKAPRD